MGNGHVKLNTDFGTQNHGIISRLQGKYILNNKQNYF